MCVYVHWCARVYCCACVCVRVCVCAFVCVFVFGAARPRFSFWSLWSAPLFVATDMRNLTAEKREILTNEEVIAIDQVRPHTCAGLRRTHVVLCAIPDGRLISLTHCVCVFLSLPSLPLFLFLSLPPLSFLSSPLSTRVQDPLSITGKRIFNATDGGQAWSKPLEQGNLAVILYNSHNKNNITVTVTWDQVQ